MLFAVFWFELCQLMPMQILLSYDAYSSEIATVPYKFISSDGFYTALPFVTALSNATSVVARTTNLTLSAGRSNNAYAFATTSVDYPTLMPISFVFPLFANFSNTFTNYQCFTTLPPTLEPSSSPSLLPSQIPSSAPSLSPSQEPSVAPIVITTSGPTFEPSSLPSLVFSCSWIVFLWYKSCKYYRYRLIVFELLRCLCKLVGAFLRSFSPTFLRSLSQPNQGSNYDGYLSTFFIPDWIFALSREKHL